MDIDRFRASPAGELEPIHGHDAYLQRDYSHYAFVPRPAPTTITLSQSTYNSVTKAALALGRLDFAVRRLPDPRLLIRPVLRREAQSTSELEGTYDSGQLRQRQVFIGERELGIEESRFVPVPEGAMLEDGVSDWEQWINAAVGHYQFEALHPFSDGNGRLGRLVVVLQMIEAGTLTYPVLNLSPWLKPRKEQYKTLLLDVSATGDYDPWVKFFSTAVEAQAQDMVERIEQLLTVREELLRTAREHTIRGFAVDIIEDLIGYSSITPSTAAKRHNVQYKTANDAIKRLEKLGILREITGAGYGRIYVSPRVTEIVLRP